MLDLAISALVAVAFTWATIYMLFWGNWISRLITIGLISWFVLHKLCG